MILQSKWAHNAQDTVGTPLDKEELMANSFEVCDNTALGIVFVHV